ncbi:serine/threonine protein kinase [Xenococcus sp. PCC 7305]|uniref:serine/threonine-protein kinase n=1 Tax=Xenococcus sp. PCC 7305 TaxID=102125 RepID=UPI0002ABFBCD|nr:serine/threonine-protein kinase [Xenococcus sp. PCC 7305]ELS00402.1 serine/threonine protein kinase [Xenococcus sp. PCC 7305]
MENILRGKYQLIDGVPRRIQGGQGTIHYAKDLSSSIDKTYIVKQFTPRYDCDDQLQVAKRLFVQEAEILQQLGSHSQIPQIFDYFEEDEQFFLVQELIEGQNLQQELEEKKYFTESETIDFLKNTLEVLKFVHQNSYIHRDIKPANLIRNKYDNKIYLIDFGAVKEKIKPENLDDQGNFTLTVAIGTPGYLPDEQKLGKPEFCSDIYALGMVAIQALTQIHPGNLSYDQDGNPLWRDRLPTSDYNFNPEFIELINKMVRCNYRERYQSSREVLRDLENLVDSPSPVKSGKIEINKQEINSIDRDINNQKPQKWCENKLFLPIILGLGTTFIGVAAFFLASKAPVPREDTYINANYGIKVEYPQNWTIQETDDPLYPGIIFLSPEENNTDNFLEQVKFSVERLSIILSLNEYTEEAIKEIATSNSIIEPPKKITVANREGRKVIYQGQDGLKRLEVWTIRNQKAYIATYTAETDKFGKFSKQADKIIQSLEIGY